MKTLDILLPSGKVTVVPVTRDKLPALHQKMIELQSIWIQEEFSTGDAIALHETWVLMADVFAMLPRHDNPAAVLGRDALAQLANDYEQLEQLFYGDAVDAYDGKLSEFDLKSFQGCKIWDLHKVDPRKKLQAADRFRWERNQTEASPQATSPSPPVETPQPTPSLT